MRHENYRRLNESSDIDDIQRKLKDEYSSFQDYFDLFESAFNRKNTAKLAKACANLSVIARLIAVLSIYAECLEEISDPREAKKLLKDRINSLASAHTISRTTAAAYADIADEIEYWAK